MPFSEYTEIPPYEHAHYVDGHLTPATEGKALWSNETAPPAIGETIEVTINNCGPATVTGYFVQDGFLGVVCDLTDPPQWHREQNNGEPRGHAFGAEIRKVS